LLALTIRPSLARLVDLMSRNPQLSQDSTDKAHSELGDLQLHIAGLGRQQPSTGAVAVGGPAR
jgi:hypothetical protein